MSDKDMSRRGFLKVAAALGVALDIEPAIDRVEAATTTLGGGWLSGKVLGNAV